MTPDEFSELGLKNVEVETHRERFTCEAGDHHLYRGQTVTMSGLFFDELKITRPYEAEESAVKIAKFIVSEFKETAHRTQLERENKRLKKLCEDQQKELEALRPPAPEYEEPFDY